MYLFCDCALAHNNNYSIYEQSITWFYCTTSEALVCPNELLQYSEQTLVYTATIAEYTHV